jgi:serine/threonine protein kinase
MSVKNVVDKHGKSYNIASRLGEGSQGETFLLEGGSHIVKLFKNVVNETELKSKINFLISLNLDKNYYSVPTQEIITPSCGYISEFASGMTPLSVLKMSPAVTDFQEWYLSTGGLLKRYGVLIKLANAIRSLHSKGLIYCDLSPNNVFISSDQRKHNVFLIDMDNLRYKTSIVHNIYTPFYGAPEIVKGIAPNTVMSDCYSFAVIAYELLACNHPLMGDMVDEGEPEVEEQAMRGELPWVEDQNDDSNIRSTGLPSDCFVSNKVMKLFHRTFEEGLNDPMRRPTMAEWCDALNDGLNDLLYCKDCKIHYPYSNNKQCPFCDVNPELAVAVKIQRWEEDEYYNQSTNTIAKHFSLQPIIYDNMMIDVHTSKYLKAFHLLSVYDDYDTPVAQLSIEQIEGEPGIVRLIVKPLNDYTLFFKIPELNLEQSFDSEKKFKFNISSHKTMILSVKDFTTPQRVLVI